MRFDIENELTGVNGAAQDFTGAATVSANSYQKQSAEQDLSIGRRMAVAVYFSAAGAGTTHTLEAVQADNTALTTNLAVLGTVTIDTADIILGQAVEIPIPQGSMDQLHLGFRHAASGGTTTASINAFLVPQDEIVLTRKTFPKVIDALV